MSETLPKADLEVIGAIVDDALMMGCMISVHDGEEFAVGKSRNRDKIMGALGASDSDSLVIRNHEGERIGSVLLVYGNSPGEVICDHTDNDGINALVARASEIADKQYNG